MCPYFKGWDTLSILKKHLLRLRHLSPIRLKNLSFPKLLIITWWVWEFWTGKRLRELQSGWNQRLLACVFNYEPTGTRSKTRDWIHICMRCWLPYANEMMSDFISWSVKTAWLKTHFQSLRIFFEDALQYIIPRALLNAASVVTTSQICTHVVLLLLIVEN